MIREYICCRTISRQRIEILQRGLGLIQVLWPLNYPTVLKKTELRTAGILAGLRERFRSNFSGDILIELICEELLTATSSAAPIIAAWNDSARAASCGKLCHHLIFFSGHCATVGWPLAGRDDPTRPVRLERLYPPTRSDPWIFALLSPDSTREFSATRRKPWFIFFVRLSRKIK